MQYSGVTYNMSGAASNATAHVDCRLDPRHAGVGQGLVDHYHLHTYKTKVVKCRPHVQLKEHNGARGSAAGGPSSRTYLLQLMVPLLPGRIVAVVHLVAPYLLPDRRGFVIELGNTALQLISNPTYIHN